MEYKIEDLTKEDAAHIGLLSKAEMRGIKKWKTKAF